MFVFLNVCVKCQPSHIIGQTALHSPIMCLYFLSSVLWCPFRFAQKSDVRFVYLQLFLGGPVSCLRYLCLFAYSGVQHILYCAVVLLVFVFCTLCCQFLWIVHFRLPLRYLLTCIFINWVEHYYLYSLIAQ
jgi:hypothetical protein